ADLLQERIEDGTYPAGSLMPSEPELAAQLRVSRVTVNKAMGILRAAGQVKVKRGSGTYVRSLPTIERDARQRYAQRNRGKGAAHVELTRLGLRPRTEYAEIRKVRATQAVADALSITEGDDVLVRPRMLYANDEPTQIADSFYPWEIVKGSPLLN